MDIKHQIKKFDEENKPFYMVDHGDGVYSLCLPFSFLSEEYRDFGQEAFNQYAIRAGEPVKDGRFYTHGDGHEWKYVFEKAFEGEENLKQITFDCEAGGFFCYSHDFEILALRLMELTVMEEGKLYYDTNGLPRRYPKFVPEEYVVLELSPRYQNGEWVIWNQEFPAGVPEEILRLGEEFSHLKVGFRGDLRFYENPNIYEVAELLQEQMQTPQITM